MLTLFLAHLLFFAMAWMPCCCREDTSSGAPPPPPSSSSSGPQLEHVNDCVRCLPDTASRWHRVTVEGIVNGDCAQCDDLNADYVIEIGAGGTSNEDGCSGNTCCGSIDLDGPICADPAHPGDPAAGYVVATLFLRNLAFFLDRIYFHLAEPGAEFSRRTINYRLSRPNVSGIMGDCTLDGTDIPFVNNSGVPPLLCDATASTCTATAIPPP